MSLPCLDFIHHFNQESIERTQLEEWLNEEPSDRPVVVGTSLTAADGAIISFIDKKFPARPAEVRDGVLQ